MEVVRERRAPPLLIPWARNQSGALVSAAQAEKSVALTCPSCDSHLLLRQGTKRRPHFAHSADSSCNSETALHLTAKLLIAQVVSDWTLRGGPCPEIVRTCGLCFRAGSQPLPSTVKDARVEQRLASGRIADVALVDGATIFAAVEVLVSNSVSEAKSGDIGVPWLELSAEEVLATPLLWRPVKANLRPYTCKECRAEAIRRNRECSEIAARLRITLPPSPPYRWAPYDCWKCHAKIVVFSWEGHGMWSQEPPPQPAPKSIRVKKTGPVPEGYWANNCQACGVVQGDFELFACEGLFPDRHDEELAESNLRQLGPLPTK